MSEFKFDYRIASMDAGCGERYYCIIEIFENQLAYVKKHSDPQCTNLKYIDLDEVRDAIKSMTEALDKPIIDLDNYPDEL
jgi:uncharacterized protein YqgV (UPF0045/DUF77 family)